MSIPDNRKHPRVNFASGVDTWIMAIDGTWRIKCTMKDASARGARLILDSLDKMHEKEFFLLLSSTGLAYRRCHLVWINGNEIGVEFQKVKR
jgi:hypothetical protein